MDQEFLSQLTSAAVVVYALQWLKRSTLFPWITMESERLNRLLAGVGAAISAAGVHFAFAVAENTSGTYVITISGLSLLNVLHGLWHVVNQFAIQQLAFDAVVKPKGTA